MKHFITHHIVPRGTSQRADSILAKYSSQITTYLEQLFWWNKKINLVSRDVSRETVQQHIQHSLLLGEFKVFKDSEFVVDAGTGGGLPGLPLSIVNPKKEFLLNDIVSKKILAIKQMVRKLQVSNVSFDDNSIENLPSTKKFLLVSKHAFKINQLYNMTKDKNWTQMVFYKGNSFENELQNISDPLNISVYDLSSQSNRQFYKGKSIIIIQKK